MKLVRLAGTVLVLATTAEAQWRNYRVRNYQKSPYSHNTEAVRRVLSPLADQYRESVVVIYCGGERVACGVIVDAAGLIVTKASELSGPVEVQLNGSTAKLPAQRLGDDEPNDLALLKIDPRANAARLTTARLTRDAGNGKAVKRPLVPVKFTSERRNHRAIEPTADHSLGVGSFLVTISDATVPEAFGVMSVPPHPRRLRLQIGVRCHRVRNGMRLYEIMPDTAAARTGLLVGDIVVAIAGQPVKTWLQFRDAMAAERPGTDLKLRLLRDGETLDVAIPLREDPSRHGPKSAHERAKLWGPLNKVRLGFAEVIQHDSVVHPSRCGSLLVDLDGTVVGMNIARSGRFETLALPATVVAAAIARINSRRRRR